MDNKENKRGFSGLSDLASEVSDIDEPLEPESKPEAKPPESKEIHQPHQESTSSQPERESINSAPPLVTVSSGKSIYDSIGKRFLGIFCVVFVIWLIHYGWQISKRPSYNPPSSQSYNHPQSNSAPSVQTPSTPKSVELHYEKPSVGTNNVLSVLEIRWCIREGIRIEAMRDIIDNNPGVDKYNRIVDDYNSRCGSYRYRQGYRTRAKRDVEAYRSQIVKEAIQEAMQFGRSYQSSSPSALPSASTIRIPKKPNAQHTREAQQLLTDLGYDPGPIDGQYGRRTASAVKAFQRELGLEETGRIDQALIILLNSVNSSR